MATAQPDPEQAVSSDETGRRVQRALDTLSPAHRAVIVLRHFLECSYDEIGRTLDLPAKTVKSRLFTARRRLPRWRRDCDRPPLQTGNDGGDEVILFGDTFNTYFEPENLEAARIVAPCVTKAKPPAMALQVSKCLLDLHPLAV